MDTFDEVLSSKWRVNRQLNSGWKIETVDQLYGANSIKNDGTPKKGAKPKTIIIALVFSKTIGQHICDVHNLFLAQDKATLLKDEIGAAIQQVLQRYGLNNPNDADKS